jgi:competence protein ComEA
MIARQDMPTPLKQTPPSDLLRPRDRGAVAVVLGCCFALLGLTWLRHGGHRGDVIDVDRATPLVARFQVDVNRADWPELIQLPGVGQTLAERMVADRLRHGRFRDVEDLSRVPGIGPRTLEQIRPYILPIPSDRGIAQR